MILFPITYYRQVEKTMHKFCSSFRNTAYPDGKIAEKAMRGSAFLAIWHCILNAD